MLNARDARIVNVSRSSIPHRSCAHQIECRPDILRADIGEESDPADVHPHDRAVRGDRDPHAAQEGAITADSHDEV